MLLESIGSVWLKLSWTEARKTARWFQPAEVTRHGTGGFTTQHPQVTLVTLVTLHKHQGFGIYWSLPRPPKFSSFFCIHQFKRMLRSASQNQNRAIERCWHDWLTDRCQHQSRSHRRREPGCQQPRCPPGGQRGPKEASEVRHLSRPCSPAQHGPQSGKWGPVPRLQPRAACCHATPGEQWSSHWAAACRWRMPPQPTPAGWSYAPSDLLEWIGGGRAWSAGNQLDQPS